MIQMKECFYHAQNGEVVSVQMRHRADKVLFECQDVMRFMNLFMEGDMREEYPPHACLRGIIVPFQSAHFQLLDQFGIRDEEILRLEGLDVQTRLMDMIW